MKKKLQLRTETIAKLSQTTLAEIRGGLCGNSEPTGACETYQNTCPDSCACVPYSAGACARG